MEAVLNVLRGPPSMMMIFLVAIEWFWLKCKDTEFIQNTKKGIGMLVRCTF